MKLLLLPQRTPDYPYSPLICVLFYGAPLGEEKRLRRRGWDESSSPALHDREEGTIRLFWVFKRAGVEQEGREREDSLGSAQGKTDQAAPGIWLRGWRRTSSEREANIQAA